MWERFREALAMHFQVLQPMDFVFIGIMMIAIFVLFLMGSQPQYFHHLDNQSIVRNARWKIKKNRRHHKKISRSRPGKRCRLFTGD